MGVPHDYGSLKKSIEIQGLPSPGEASRQVEERLTFLSEGTTPRKNLEVMQEAIKEARPCPRLGALKLGSMSQYVVL